MNEQELKTALEHDSALKEGKPGVFQPLVLAAECFRNAALAARGAECGLTVCRPPAIAEAQKAAQMAITSLEQALTLMAMESKTHE